MKGGGVILEFEEGRVHGLPADVLWICKSARLEALRCLLSYVHALSQQSSRASTRSYGLDTWARCKVKNIEVRRRTATRSAQQSSIRPLESEIEIHKVPGTELFQKQVITKTVCLFPPCGSKTFIASATFFFLEDVAKGWRVDTSIQLRMPS